MTRDELIEALEKAKGPGRELDWYIADFLDQIPEHTVVDVGTPYGWFRRSTEFSLWRTSRLMRPPVETEKRQALGKWAFAKKFLEQGGRCNQCRAKLEKGFCADDHIIPLACGGSNELSNRQLLCPPCHKAKTDGKDKGDAARIKRRQNYAETGRSRKRKGPPMKSRPFDKTYRKKLNGQVERRET